MSFPLSSPNNPLTRTRNFRRGSFTKVESHYDTPSAEDSFGPRLPVGDTVTFRASGVELNSNNLTQKTSIKTKDGQTRELDATTLFMDDTLIIENDHLRQEIHKDGTEVLSFEDSDGLLVRRNRFGKLEAKVGDDEWKRPDMIDISEDGAGGFLFSDGKSAAPKRLEPFVTTDELGWHKRGTGNHLMHDFTQDRAFKEQQKLIAREQECPSTYLMPAINPTGWNDGW